MPSDIDAGILKSQLDRIEQDIGVLANRFEKDMAAMIAKIDRLNGTVRGNSMEIAVLKATTLRWDAVKIGGIIGLALVLLAVLGRVAGVL